MKIFVFFLFSTFLINFTLSKRFKNKTHLNKNHTKKNNTHRTFLIRTELNITEIEKLLNNNKTLDINKTIVSEIDDDYENFTLPDEIDIEIEDEIDDNGTMPQIIDYMVQESKSQETQYLFTINNEKYINKGRYGKIIPLLSFIIFIYAIIYFNTFKKNKQVVRTYRYFEVDFKEENLIEKNE